MPDRLMKCQACGYDISKLATTCPKCGHHAGMSRMVGCFFILLGLTMISFVAVFIWFHFYYGGYKTLFGIQ